MNPRSSDSRWNMKHCCLSLCNFCAENPHTYQVSKCPYAHRQQSPELVQLNTRRAFSFQNASSPTPGLCQLKSPGGLPAPFRGGSAAPLPRSALGWLAGWCYAWPPASCWGLREQDPTCRQRGWASIWCWGVGKGLQHELRFHSRYFSDHVCDLLWSWILNWGFPGLCFKRIFFLLSRQSVSTPKLK